MRLFHQLVFEGYVNGTTDVFSDPAHGALLGLPDQLSISGYAAQVTGTSPTITIRVEQSFDQTRWQNRNSTAEVAAVSIPVGVETNFQGQDGNPTSRPTLGFARLKITLGGTTPAAQLRIWVTGRDRGEG